MAPLHMYSCYLAHKDLVWISSDISFSIGISSHLEDMFTVRRSDNNECNRKFIPACFASRVQHRLSRRLVVVQIIAKDLFYREHKTG